jgi:tripartite-type tricarboxylate transporter receptor subunit TctC
MLAPAGTPVEILNLLNAACVRIMQQAEMKQRLAESGTLVIGSSREAFAQKIGSEAEKWARIIKLSGATAD